MLTFHQVVARLDLLAVVLVYVMSTGYLFYYFVSFVSILYIVVYVTTAFGSKCSGRAVILVCRALVAATDTTFVINEESLLEGSRGIRDIGYSAKVSSFRLRFDHYRIIWFAM